MWPDRSDGSAERRSQCREDCWVTDKPVSQVALGAVWLELGQWHCCVCAAESRAGLHLIISLTEGEPRSPEDTHCRRSSRSRLRVEFPSCSQAGAGGEWSLWESEQNSGRRLRGRVGGQPERERKRSQEWTLEETCFATVQDQLFPPPQQRTLQRL